MKQPPLKMTSWEHLRYWRQMPFLERNMRVLTPEGPGIVTWPDGQSVFVRLDDKKRSNRFHPWWQMVYYNQDGTIAKDYR